MIVESDIRITEEQLELTPQSKAKCTAQGKLKQQTLCSVLGECSCIEIEVRKGEITSVCTHPLSTYLSFWKYKEKSIPLKKAINPDTTQTHTQSYTFLSRTHCVLVKYTFLCHWISSQRQVVMSGLVLCLSALEPVMDMAVWL